MICTGNRTKGKIVEFTLDVESVEPWAIESLIELVDREAARVGCTVTYPRATVYFSIEYREAETSFELLKAALQAKHVTFGARAEE